MESNSFCREHRTNLVLLIIIGYFLLMFGNGIVSLTHPDEVFYVQTAKEMVAHHSWLTPRIFGAPQFEKPIFFYWLLAVLIQWFGPNSFVARFWPSFFGIVGMLLTYIMAWMLFRDRRISFWSGIVLGSSFIYIALSRAVLTDMVFSILVVITIAFFYAGISGSLKKETAVIFFFVFMGTAVLTKGLLGICFPVTCALAFSVYKKDFSFFLTPATWIGLVLFVAIALPWHVLMYQWYGQSFLNEYFQNVHVNRLLFAEHPKSDTWYFYLMLMIVGVMPWTFFLFPAVKNLIDSVRQQVYRDQFIFLGLWILSIYIFVQPAHSKLASYVFPVFPALGIVIGYYIAGCLQGRVVSKPFKWLLLSLAIFLLLLIIAANVMVHKHRAFVPDMTPVYAFSIVAGMVAIAMIVFFWRKNYVFMVRLVPGITVAVLMVLLLGRNDAEPWVSCAQISQRFNAIDRGQSVVLSSKFYVRGILFYTDRSMAVMDINGKGFFSPHPIPFLNTDDKILAFLKSQPVTYGILKAGDVKDIQRLTANNKDFSYFNLGGTGGKYIVKIKYKNKLAQAVQ